MSLRRVGGRARTLCMILLCLLLSIWAEAGVPVISNLQVADVTPRSFSIIGTVSEPSTVGFSLYSSNCSTPAIGYATALQQNQASGNMRISVTGLTADTTYCYRMSVISASSSDQTTSSSVIVKTATAVTSTKSAGSDIFPTGNDIVRVPSPYLDQSAGETRDKIIASVELLNGIAVSPLSLLLSSDPNKDYFNLNNVFDVATGKSLDLVGGERVKVTEIHGTSGCVIERYRTIPADVGGTAARVFTRINPNDIDASGGVNILDVLRLVGGKGATRTGSCFNSDFDLNGDGIIDSTDLAIIKGGFNGLP